MATVSPVTRSAPKQDAPTITILDLWYAAYKDRCVEFDYSAVNGDTHDDWLMRNMALVAYRVVHGVGVFKRVGPRAGQLVHSEGPYGISVAFNNQRQVLLVALFLKEDDGDN